MGGRGGSSGLGGFGAGQRYENEWSNVFIKNVNTNKGVVRFIDGISPSAIHDIQELSIRELRKYLKRYGYKFTGYYD